MTRVGRPQLQAYPRTAENQIVVAGSSGERGRGGHGPVDLSEAIPRDHVITAVQVADLLLRSEGIGNSGDYVPVTREQCFSAPVWNLLLANTPAAEHTLTKAAISRTLEQIPHMLDGMV